MRLNRSTLIVLGVSLLIIIGGLVLQEPLQNMVSPSTPIPINKTILPSDIGIQATQLIIRQGNSFTQVDLVDELWQVTDASALDETRETHDEFVDGLLTLMSDFEYSSRFESDNLAQFDLQDVSSSIEIHTASATYSLKFGDTNPDGDQIYMMINDDPSIYLIPNVFELANIIKLATAPPYRQIQPEATATPTSNLLFPDIFGYQIAEFTIRDQRDGSFIRYTQGDLGTWIVEGTVVDDDQEIDHVQAAINVSKFLFLEIESLPQQVRESLTDVAILTLSMTTDDSQSYTMNVTTHDEIGFVGVLSDGSSSIAYPLDADTINLFFDMVRQPPYTSITG